MSLLFSLDDSRHIHKDTEGVLVARASLRFFDVDVISDVSNGIWTGFDSRGVKLHVQPRIRPHTGETRMWHRRPHVQQEWQGWMTWSVESWRRQNIGDTSDFSKVRSGSHWQTTDRGTSVFLVMRPNSILHFWLIFLHPLFPMFWNPTFKNGYFCPSSPFDHPKCQTIVIVRVCVKASPTDAFTRTRLMLTFWGSGLKLHWWCFFGCFRVFRCLGLGVCC